jgi:hypothetical protein
MTNRRLLSFIDAIAVGRRPHGYRADPEDIEMVRTAITLRAARPGDDIVDPEFVSTLRAQLADQVSSPSASNIREFKPNRVRTALVAVAASVVLVGATVVTTDAFNQPSTTTSAGSALHSGTVRTGTFEAKNGQVLGQIVVVRGHPSWVFMNVNVESSNNGSVICKLQMDDGAIVSAGTVELHHGMGELGKAVVVDISRLRRATISTPEGAALGSAALA